MARPLSMFVSCFLLFSGTDSWGVPRPAALAGFSINTFSTKTFKEDVDSGGSGRSGYKWYLGQFFGYPKTSSNNVLINEDGTVTLRGAAATINSAGPTRGLSNWSGRAFGGGGYFEAVLKVKRPVSGFSNRSSWPAFWSMAIEHLAPLPGEQWNGQAVGYKHFIEADFFEDDLVKSTSTKEYGGAIHDWFGLNQKTCSGKALCQVANTRGGGTNFENFRIQVPEGTDFSKYHAYGFLWVPATPSSVGYAQYFFDGIPTSDKVTWTRYSGQPPEPGTAPWTFGIIDQQHLVLLLSGGVNESMTVKSVSVFQSTANGNLSPP